MKLLLLVTLLVIVFANNQNTLDVSKLLNLIKKIEKKLPVNTLKQLSEPKQAKFVFPLIQKITVSNLKKYLQELTSIPYRNTERGMNPTLSFLASTVKKIIYNLKPQRRKLFKMTSIKGKRSENLMITMKGILKESIVFGAHSDDVGKGKNSGADDNGSGVVSVLETLRVLGESIYVPVRTIHFIFYTEEEDHGLGSKAVAQKFKKDGKKVFAVLNYDMVGYTKSHNFKTFVVQKHTNFYLNKFLSKLIKKYSKLTPMNYKMDYNSDHIRWNQSRFASTCLKEYNWSPHYHQKTDKYKDINFEYLKEHVKVSIAFCIELSSK